MEKAIIETERRRNHPLLLNCNGTEIAILNFTYGTNLGAGAHWPKVNYMSDCRNIEEALKASDKSDLTLVLPHWGEEYSLKHSENQRNTWENIAFDKQVNKTIKKMFTNESDYAYYLTASYLGKTMFYEIENTKWEDLKEELGKLWG